MAECRPSSQLHLDVTGQVDVTDAQSVCVAVIGILRQSYPTLDFVLLQRVYRDFDTLYTGKLQGFLACDTSYHDSQHVLDVSLAMARLLDGYAQSRPQHERLDDELALIGMIVALFHDSGYIRRNDEKNIVNGAAYTRIHVSRSARFLAEYLPSIGRADWVALTDKLVHFTGYEYTPDQIELDDANARTVGCLVGTADVIAQMADRAYLQKCRDYLYPEFQAGGMTHQTLEDGTVQVLYRSAEELLLKTPDFIRNTIKHRLEGHFQGVYHYVAEHFGGRNLYMDALLRNCRQMEQLIADGDVDKLDKLALTQR